MFVIVSKYLVPSRFAGITLFPFILLRSQRDKENPVTVNHERIHLRQQLELLLIFFYLWYVLEFVIRLAFTRNRFAAYRSISFEREAYGNEYDPTYLERRKMWAFLKFFKSE